MLGFQGVGFRALVKEGVLGGSWDLVSKDIKYPNWGYK